jgi:class 3 adenylate cyclase/YHS domain-containing protein
VCFFGVGPFRRFGGRFALIAKNANFYTVSQSRPSPPDDSRGDSTDLTRSIAFIDLAGFTALVDTHGDQAAVTIADELVRVTLENLCEHGTMVKTIGDAVMLAFTSPAAAVRTVTDIVSSLAHVERFPMPSAGMHHGSVVERSGDLFGRRVNIAARLADAAAPGEVLCTRPVADAANLAGFSVRHRGSLQLKNIPDPITCYRVELPGVLAGDVDPVCRMRVRASAHQLAHAGRTWHFCSEECASIFAERPDDFGGS